MKEYCTAKLVGGLIELFIGSKSTYIRKEDAIKLINSLTQQIKINE